MNQTEGSSTHSIITLMGFCAVWSGIGCAVWAAFPGSRVAFGIGVACMSFSITAPFSEYTFGRGGFVPGFLVGGVGGLILGLLNYGKDPAGELPVSGLMAALAGGFVGAICGPIFLLVFLLPMVVLPQFFLFREERR